MILKENEAADLIALDVPKNQSTNFYNCKMHEIKNKFSEIY